MKIRSTTVLAVLRDGCGAIGSDGQVTLGNTVAKHGAVKVRELFQGQVLAGFAGSAADGLTLFEKFEGHLDRFSGHLRRATVELAREWRSDRILRKLEAMMVVTYLCGNHRRASVRFIFMLSNTVIRNG